MDSSPWDYSPGFLLWHATLRWQRQITAVLKPLGLTHVQFVLLAGSWWLGRGGQPPSQRELADHSGTDAGQALARRAIEAVEAADRAYFRHAEHPETLIPQLRSLARPPGS